MVGVLSRNVYSKNLRMGMWLVYSSACACDSHNLVSTRSQATESQAPSKENGNLLILAIPIPSSLRLCWFLFTWSFLVLRLRLRHWLRLRRKLKLTLTRAIFSLYRRRNVFKINTLWARGDENRTWTNRVLAMPQLTIAEKKGARNWTS